MPHLDSPHSQIFSRQSGESIIWKLPGWNSDQIAYLASSLIDLAMETYRLALEDACCKFARPWSCEMLLASEAIYKLATGPKKSSHGSATNFMTKLRWLLHRTRLTKVLG